MISEPHKIKTIRKIHFTHAKERQEELKKASFNTFNINSEKVTFDMTSHGTSAMSQEQLSGILLGDEAYAGSLNFEHLQNSVKKVFGEINVCPSHNLLGALKLISATMVKEGETVISNSLFPKDLTEDRKATLFCAKTKEKCLFSGDFDLEMVKQEISKNSTISYIYVETFAQGYEPISFDNLKKVSDIAEKNNIKLIIDTSKIVSNAMHIMKNEESFNNKPMNEIVKEIVSLADICVLDAKQEPKCNTGGLIFSWSPELIEPAQNEVVVYEGLHTYGGMAGRTMEIFARGIDEMIYEDQVNWSFEQIKRFSEKLKGIPFITGCDGIYIRADEFLPGIENNQAHLLASAIYLKTGVRAFLEGRFADEKILPLQIPRLTLTNNQLSQIADSIIELFNEKEKIKPLKLINKPDWHDEAKFEWELPDLKEFSFDCEAYTIHTLEYIRLTTKEQREKLVKETGYNTFLLPSKDITIDFLTDSGTNSMTIEQWQKYTGGTETSASSKDYFEVVETLKEITGYKYIIPTHQGRAAEHIMSQVIIKGGFVPGNMYFTTTKLHQELAGGTFTDIIVDEAHIPSSKDIWKGNIDLNKLDKIVKEHGVENIPYISFETSVNMAGGQPVSMDNAKEVYEYCKNKGILVMLDATRITENAYMIQLKDPRYHNSSIKEILLELFSYGDGCTVSAKKDYLVNIGGFLAYKDNEDLYKKSLDMLRKYEGSVTTGGLSGGDLAVLAQGTREMVEEDYISARVKQTHYLGKKLLEAGIPIVEPPGTHAIFLDVKRFLPHIDQEEYPAQALASQIFVECGVRAMERGNVSKGRDPKTGKNYCPPLELVRLTIPRRVYTNDHMDMVADAIISVYKNRDQVKGLRFTYEPEKLRFFLGRFEPVN